jgi:gliding motility-associated lipoprotein GldD
MHRTNYKQAVLKFLTLLILLTAFGCGNNDYIPKPRGYFRIELPEKEYIVFDTTFPYTFEYPVYAKVLPDNDPNTEPYWANLDFESFKGRLHLSYKPVNGNLYQYFEDAHNFVSKHIPKAEDIVPVEVSIPENRVYGLVYDIKGVGAASSYQFCVTDSVQHYLRGALYFYTIPNNDSLSPVLDFIKKDIDHMIETLQWKQVSANKIKHRR